MSQLFIVTTPQNSGDGTPLSTAFNYTNSNFSELYARYQTVVPTTLIGKTGDVPGMYATDSTYFYYCFAAYNGTSTIWAQVTQVNNLSISQLQNGSSNVTVAANANVTVSVGGIANVALFTTSGVSLTGNVNASGNVRGAYVLGNGSQLTGLPATYSDSNVVTLLSSYGSNNISTTGAITGGSVTGSNLYTAGVVSAAGNVRGGNINTVGAVVATGNVSSQGVVSALGNITTSGYFVGTFLGNVTGNFVVPGSNTQVLFNTNGNADATAGMTFDKNGPNLFTVLGTISSPGNIIGGNVNTAGLVSAGGNVRGGNINTGGTISATGAINTAGAVSATGTVTGGNLATGGTISGTGNITGGNLITAGAVGATGNISATGNITGGNIRAGNIAVTSNISATNFTGTTVSTTGNVSAGGYILGNISFATGAVFGYNNSNVAAFLANFGSNNISTTGSVNAAFIAVTGSYTGASINVTGNVAGNILVGNSLISTGNVTGGNLLLGAGGQITTPFGSNGNVSINPDGTGLFIVTPITPAVFGNTLTVNQTITAGNLSTTGNITGNNITGNLLVGALDSTSQNSITQTGTLGSLSVTATVQGGNLQTGGRVSATGNITGGNLSIGAGTITVGNIVCGAGNSVGTIGTPSTWFGNAYIQAVNALYADLAENYTADAVYEAGTVVVFGGDNEITTTTQFADVAIAGVISTNPAYLMNSGEEGLPVALRGRTPVKVVGPVYKGDLLVTAGANPGYAVSVGRSTEHPLAVFAKSIETNTNEGVKVITAVIV